MIIDSHFRIGGARGTGLQAPDCPKLTGAVNPKCIAGSMLLHMTATSTGYLENVWAWVADHDLDSNVAQTRSISTSHVVCEAQVTGLTVIYECCQLI